MKKRTRLTMLAGLFSLATLATPAMADLAVDITGETGIGLFGTAAEGPASPGGTYGYAFRLTQSVTVTSLGVLDAFRAGSGGGFPVGLLHAHDVAIWTSGGTQVASATVPATLSTGTCSSTVATASAAEESSWCFVDITDVVLAAGDYVIGAYYLNGGDPFRFRVTDADLSLVSGMTLLDSGLNIGGSSLALPTFAAGQSDRGYFGPNFQVADAVTVPEPGSLALVGLAIAGIGLSRRRKAG